MRKVFAVLIISLLVSGVLGVSAQGLPAGFDLLNYGVRIEPDKRLIVVLSALEMATAKNAAGVDEKLIKTPLSPKSAMFREQLLSDNANLPEDLKRRISTFVAQYKKRNSQMSDADIIGPFISMAYTLTPVPELSDPVITNDLPGSVLDVLDFAPLVREFYRKSSISSKLDDYVKDYQDASDQILKSSAREMVSELLDYLHTRPKLVFTERIVTETQKGKSKRNVLRKVETKQNERRFFLVPERLTASNNVNFLNIRDDYYVIVSPDTDLSFSDVRRAFLQFVIDPLILKNSKEIGVVRDWVKPLLDERRKAEQRVTPDVYITAVRSLVAAIDVRQIEYSRMRIATEQARDKITLLKTEAEKKAFSAELAKYIQSLSDESALRLYEDYEKGAVLSFYFAEQLKGIEGSGFDIGSSLREMIAAFDPVRETQRVAASAEARARAVAAREERKKNPDTNTFAAENPLTTRLLEIQKTIEAQDYTKATAELKSLSTQNPAEPRIYYNIGRVAGLSAVSIDDPEEQAQLLLEAKTAYANVLKTATASTDRALLSLTYVALARIYEFHNDFAYSIRLYDEAIKLGDIRNGGYNEALNAKARLIKQ